MADLLYLTPADKAPILGVRSAGSPVICDSRDQRLVCRKDDRQQRSQAASDQHESDHGSAVSLRRVLQPTFQERLQAMGVLAFVALECPTVSALEPAGPNRWRVGNQGDGCAGARIAKEVVRLSGPS